MTYNGHNYEEIETALVALGATAQEADALTDVLHVEGWGGVEDSDMNDAVLVNMIAWLRENRPVDPRADWDDSNYIDIIESEKERWFSASPCTTPTSEETDASINKMLGFPPGGCIHVDGLAGALKNETEDEIRASVSAGLDAWYGTVDTSAVEHYDQLPEPSERREYRENDFELSIATKEQLDAIDAGRKAPCLA